MHLLRQLTDALWILPAIFEAAIAVWMVRRRLSADFPCFLVYLASDAAFTIVLFVLDKLPGVPGYLWFDIYIPRLAITTLLRFCVLYEVSSFIFRNHPILTGLGKAVFRGVLLVFLLAGIGAAALTRSHEAERGFATLHLLQQTASFMQIGLLASLFVLSVYYSLSWRNFAFGIALGTGIDSAINLAAAAIKAQFGLSGNAYLNLLTVGAYDLCVLTWIFYLLVPERSTVVPVDRLPDHDLDLWNKELQRLTQQ
jgi:hypothetical protein